MIQTQYRKLYNENGDWIGYFQEVLFDENELKQANATNEIEESK